MKRTLIGIAAIAIVTISGSVTASLNIERSGTTIGSTKSYDQIRNGLGLNFTYIDHDDSVGTRGNSSSPTGSSVVNSDTSKANDTLGTINCSHQAYKALCSDIQDMIDDAYVPPAQPEAPDYTAHKVACEAKSSQFSTWTVKKDEMDRSVSCLLHYSQTTSYFWNDTLNICDTDINTTSWKGKCHSYK